MSSSFDSFVTETSDDSVNFLTPTFESFARDTNYALEITSAEVAEGKFGKQIELKVDAIVGEARSAMGKIWVPLMEPSAEQAAALALPPEHPDHKKAAQGQALSGRNLASFLRAVAPETFNLYRIEKQGNKNVPVSVKTGEVIEKADREAIDSKLSNAVMNFSKACVAGSGTGMLVGKRFFYRVEARKKDPTKTNQVFMLESDVA
jgi:hypothetical protein